MRSQISKSKTYAFFLAISLIWAGISVMDHSDTHSEMASSFFQITVSD